MSYQPIKNEVTKQKNKHGGKSDMGNNAFLNYLVLFCYCYWHMLSSSEFLKGSNIFFLKIYLSAILFMLCGYLS